MGHQLNWRYATQKFDANRSIPDKDFEDLLEALRLSPSSFGLQPWKFVIVRNKALREQLRQFAWNQSQITDASELLVLCVKTGLSDDYIKDFIKKTSTERSIPLKTLEGYRDAMLGFLKSRSTDEIIQWMTHQVYIALGVLLSECAYRNIDACPIEGFDSQKFDEVLKLKEQGLHAVILCALGHRSADDVYAQLAKIRFAPEEVVIRK